MLHHKRLRDPAYFKASWYCNAHGVYACIPCQSAPPTAEAQEAEAMGALADARALDAEAHVGRLSRALADAEARAARPRRSLLSKMGQKGGRKSR
jgi:hypothetical protein